MAGLGPMELGIILLIAILLFGGSRLAGVGKASGRAIREFKEETADLKKPKQVRTTTTEVVDGQVVEHTTETRTTN